MPEAAESVKGLTGQVVEWEPGWWDVERESYHNDKTMVSSSGLECFRQSIPRFYGLHVLGTIPKPDPTPALLFGNVLHTLLLEPAVFNDRYIVISYQHDGRTKEGRAEREATKAEANGREMITRAEYELAKAMIDSIHRNPKAVELIMPFGKFEPSIRWVDKETGIPCRARFDRWVDGAFENATIVDIKTCADPSPDGWVRAVGEFGYHRQQAFYMAGAAQALGETPDYYFIAIGKEPPHETIVYQLEEEDYNLGVRQVAFRLAEMKQCMVFDSWAGRWAGNVYKPTLKLWHRMEE